MAKKTKSFSLDEKVIEVIEKKAVKDGRSESFIANEILIAGISKTKTKA